MLPRHRGLGDGLLHGLAVCVRRFRPEVVEAEPALQLLAGIVPLTAPVAGGLIASSIPKPAHEMACFRELVAHPGRHHRVAAGHRQPRQCVGEWPARVRCGRHGLPSVGRAGLTVKQAAYCSACLNVGGAMRATHLGEEIVESAVCAPELRRGQPVPGRKQVG